MARKRRPNEPASYVPDPEVPAEVALRYRLVIATLAQQLTVTEASAQAGIARPNFQTVLHRVKATIVAALLPRPSGRPATAPETKALAAKTARLEKQVAKQAKTIATMDELLGVAGDVIRELRGMPPLKWRQARETARAKSSPRSSPSSKRSAPSDPEDPEPEPATATPAAEDPLVTALLARLTSTMTADTERTARALGVGTSTLRRYLARRALALPAARRRGAVRRPVTAEAAGKVRGLVRVLGRQLGAASLAHSVAGVSRRQAQELKADELCAMERERRAACARVDVLAAGVIRGFDAMHVNTTDGMWYALVAAEASVPFRTAANVVPAYDSAQVARAIELDLAMNGAPLVYRLDRASCHRTAEVASVLERHGVLVLHGPPRHPRFYGQLERQNLEHRAWLDRLGLLTPDELTAEWRRMLTALNELWRRRTLDWNTAATVWAGRRAVNDNRTELREEVTNRAARLRGTVSEEAAQRFAIEDALIARGYLRTQPGRQVLCA